MINRMPPSRRAKFALCRILIVLSLGALAVVARAQPPEQQPTEENPEAEIEPSPLPGTEIPLEPQLPPSEKPLPRRMLKLAPPGIVEPILPTVNLEALARSGRLWSFHGVVKEFRFVGNHVFSSGELGRVVEKYRNRELTAEDLEQARQDLTLLYITRDTSTPARFYPTKMGEMASSRFNLSKAD